MKKILFLIITLFSVCILSGCGKNDNIKILKCSGVNKGNNMNAYGEVKYTFKDDKLSKAELTATFKDITIDDLSSQWDSIKTQFTEQNEPVEEVGYKRSVRSDDKNYTFTVLLEIDFEKISKETMEKYEVSYSKDITYEEVKKDTEEEGTFVCE